MVQLREVFTKIFCTFLFDFVAIQRYLKHEAKVIDTSCVGRLGKSRLHTISVAISTNKHLEDIAFEEYPTTKSTITSITCFVITYLKKTED